MSTPTRPHVAPPRPADGEAETLAPAAPAGPAEAAAAGVTIPGYEVFATLGRGGMGVVYQARQTGLGRVVALKMILSGAHAGEADLARFRTEAEAIARLQHPNIVQIHEVGEHGGLPYFSLEFCAGGSLEKKLSGTPLPPGEAAALVEALARAMQAAHEKGVIHRDLKPANVLLAEAGQTATGSVMGTPSYMAPEQAGGKAVGPLADVYALGAILYECLTGRPPFKAATPLDTILQVVANEPVLPTQLQPALPRDLETICLKCLQKEPANRYDSAGALADDLRRFAEARPIVARPVGRAERAAKWVRRNPVLAAMAAGVALALLGGTAVSTWFGIAARRQAELAGQNEADANAKGKELATANVALTRTAADLQRSRDELETTLARSLLRPLGLPNMNTSMAEAEWEALWELATSRRGRLGYRFVEEATRTPTTSRQLRERAIVALPAAVGLDAGLRADVEALLMSRLDDPALGDEQKTNLLLATAAWDGLSRAAAARTASQLVAALAHPSKPDDVGPLADSLSVVVARLPARDGTAVLARAATALVRAMEEDPPADAGVLEKLGLGVRELTARMDPNDAMTFCGRAAAVIVAALKKNSKDPRALDALGLALVPLGHYLGARDAARVAVVLAEILRTGATRSFGRPYFSLALPAVAGRLESRDAAQLFTTLLPAVKDTDDLLAVTSVAALVQGLSAASTRLEARDAARAADSLTRDMTDGTGAVALSFRASVLAQVLTRLEPREAAAISAGVVPTVGRAIKRAKAPWGAGLLTSALAGLAARMEPRDGLAAFLDAVKDVKDPGAFPAGMYWRELAARADPQDAAAALARAVKDAGGPPLRQLAEVLAEVAARMAPADAATTLAGAAALAEARKDTAEAAALRQLADGFSAAATAGPQGPGAARVAAVARAIKAPRAPYVLPRLAQGLSAMAPRLGPADAAQVAVALAQAVKVTRDPNHLSYLVQALSAVAVRLGPRDAAKIVPVLVQSMKDTAVANALPWRAQGLSALVARLEAGDAEVASAQAAATLVQATKEPRNHYYAESLAQGLSLLLSAAPPADVFGRAATAASAVAFPADAGQALPALGPLIAAGEPPPGRLSSQQLVELLKMPNCMAEYRGVLLAHLGTRYRRSFADVWEFVGFAQEQNLGLDFTTPPRRPQTPAPAR